MGSSSYSTEAEARTVSVVTRIEVPDPFEGLQPLPARLVADTIGPHQAGGRGHQVSSRHLLYEVGSLYLDLLQDRDGESNRSIVMGLLAARGDSGSIPQGAPVILERDGVRLGGTFCSLRGEFVFRAPLEGQTQLRIKVDRGHFVAVPLDPPPSEAS